MKTVANESQAPEPTPPRRGLHLVAVAAAAIVGFLVGSTGLAMAGALPAPAQDAAHDVLAVVQIDVPSTKADKRGPCVSQAAKIADPTEKQTAKDACPKGPFGKGVADAPGRTGGPGRSDDAPGHSDPPKPADKHADDPCKGKPPWAGNPDYEGERVRPATCPPDDDESDESEEPEGVADTEG